MDKSVLAPLLFTTAATNYHHLRLAPLRVRSATGRQQSPEWSVLGQVNCVGP